MEKKCTKCGEVKSLDEFYNTKLGKNGKNARCKYCVKLYAKINKEHIKKRQQEYRKINLEKRKEYYKKNKEHIKKRQQEYQQKNKEKISQHAKEYYKKNKEKILLQKKEYNKKNKETKHKYQKEYYKNNKERFIEKAEEYRKKNKEYNKEYKQYNKEKIKEYNKEYLKERIKTDPLFKLTCSIRKNIGNSLIKSGYTKKAKSYNILKCEYNFFMDWLNGKASNGYTYGIDNLHLDHVIPISLAETEDEAYLLNHYSNFQLLTSEDNISKGNRYVNPTNLKRVLEHHPNPDKIREIHSRL